MSYVIQSLNRATPQFLRSQEKEVWTGFAKKPATQPVYLSETGFAGDGQGDLKNHGGTEKAVLFYPYSHYSFWEAYYGRSFALPSFGENITITGITEKEVCIGDTFQMGEAMVQICQPRNPCYKIARFHQLKDIPSVVTSTGYSGFYARVLKEGNVSSGEEMILLKKGEKELTIANVFEALFQPEADIERMKNVLASEYAADSLKNQIQKKLNQYNCKRV